MYAAFVIYRGVRYPAALMIGGDFTTDAKPKVEVHLLGQHMELVGEELAVEVVAHVSDMRRVASVRELLKKIEDDIQKVRICLRA